MEKNAEKEMLQRVQDSLNKALDGLYEYAETLDDASVCAEHIEAALDSVERALTSPNGEHETIFDEIVDSLPDANNVTREGLWTDGEMILCRRKEQAEGIADMIQSVSRCRGEKVTAVTGYYDPSEEPENDTHTGYWYVNID